MSMQGAKWLQWDAVSGQATAGPRRCTSVRARASGPAAGSAEALGLRAQSEG